MNSTILLSILAVAVAFAARLGESSPASILKDLASIRLNHGEDLVSRCEIYEKFLSANHAASLASTQQNNAGLIPGLLQVIQTTGIQPEARPQEAILEQLKDCAKLVAKSQLEKVASDHIVGPAALASNERVLPVSFSSVGLAKLSQARQNVKSLALDMRCDAYDEALRTILVGQEVASESKPVLFRSVLRALAARQVPFQNGQAPFVETLGECVSHLSAYQGEEAPATQRTVVAGPGYSREPLGPKEVDPVASMRDEFNQVKKKVVDHGQDLYAGARHGAGEDELKYRADYRPSETNAEIDYTVDMDVPRPSHEQANFEIDSNERYRPKSSSGLVNQYIVDETYDELARKESDPIRRLELLLESERRANKKLLQQLDDNQYELGGLRDQVVQLKRVLGQQKGTGANPLEESRLFELKRLYEQASEREQRSNEKYEHLLRKYEDLEARLMLERSLDDDKYVDLDEDDDDDHDDDDEDDHELNKDWLKKEKKELKRQEKREKKEEKEFKKAEKELKKKADKELKKLVGEKTEDGDKIYRDPVDMARKLQNKMKSSEPLEQRCQKYYALLNHPGKVTKKVLKTIAKLNLPKSSASTPNDPEYFKSLTYYADLLAHSDNKDAREASAEMKRCLELAGPVNYRQQVPFYGRGHEVDYESEDDDVDYPSPYHYANHYNGGSGGLLGGNHYQQQTKRSPSASGFDVPVEFVTNPRKSLSRGNSNKYASAYASAKAGGSGPTVFARFGPTSKLAKFQADHY